MHDERGPESRAAAEYLNGRWQEESDYFETKSRHNQRLFIRMRDIMLLCSWFTPGTYQWEEVHNYGAQWAKFRLISKSSNPQSTSYAACSRYFQALCGIFTLDSAEYAGNRFG